MLDTDKLETLRLTKNYKIYFTGNYDINIFAKISKKKYFSLIEDLESDDLIEESEKREYYILTKRGEDVLSELESNLLKVEEKNKKEDDLQTTNLSNAKWIKNTRMFYLILSILTISIAGYTVYLNHENNLNKQRIIILENKIKKLSDVKKGGKNI